MIDRTDLVRLRHMLDAARTAVRLAEGGSREDLDDPNEALVHALVRLVSVVGEAAGRVGPETREQIAAIPWPDVVGMRNRLIHEYFDVNLGILWATVQDDLPQLIRDLEEAVPELSVPDQAEDS